MSLQNETLLREGACALLRTKNFFTGEDDPRLSPKARMEFCANAHFWCAKTQYEIGPDGEPIDAQACVAGRRCFRDATDAWNILG